MKRIILFVFLSVSAFAQLSSTGSITATGSTCAVTNACISLNLFNTPELSTASVSIGITGTYSGTIQFEASPDGVNFASVQGAPQQGGAAVTSTTSTGTWIFAVPALSVIRARASAYSSGTATILIQASTAPSSSATGSSTPNYVSVTNTVPVTLPTSGGNPCASGSATTVGLVSSMSTTAAVQIIALSAGKSVYFCSTFFGNGSGTTPTVSLEYGTGANCATGTTVILPAVVIPAGTAPPTLLPSNWYTVPVGNEVCYVLTGTTPTGTLTANYIQQ